MTPGLKVQATDAALADEVDRMARGTTDGTVAAAGSRRLSGSAWQPSRPIPEVDPAGTALLPVAVRRPRRRRRRWYRRKLVLIPTILALLIAGVASAMLLRAGSTIAELQEVSTPPPSVALQDDEGQPEVQIDTAAAAAAVQEARVARGEQQQDEGGSLFGDFKDKAGDVGDVAGGAAAAAGLTNPETGTINVLVMGVDARPGAPIDIAVKADAILVLHLNPETKSCRILSIPRDTRTELPGYGQSKADLLASDRMRDLITDLTQTVDLVLIDTPPILAATDPLVVAPNVSGVVLICRANRTRRDALRRAAQALQQGGIRIIGTVLNQNSAREGSYYYYEGYYGPRGPAAPEGAETASPSKMRSNTADAG